VEHLGYVQIDTINVNERSHHHIIWTESRYRRADLHQAQSIDKSVFEYWTHAFVLCAAKNLRFFMPAMSVTGARATNDGSVQPGGFAQGDAVVRRDGALTIRDIDETCWLTRRHPWPAASRRSRALQLAFYQGLLTISEAQRHAQDL